MPTSKHQRPRTSKPTLPPPNFSRPSGKDRPDQTPRGIQPRATVTAPTPRNSTAHSTQSPLPLLPSSPLPPLTKEDREKLDLFSHCDADLIALAKYLSINPTEALEWSLQSHIQPWLAALSKARADHRESELMRSLTLALDNIKNVLNSSASDKLKLTAVNSMVKVASAILRGTRPPRGSPKLRPHHNGSLGEVHAAHIYQHAELALSAVTDSHLRLHRTKHPHHDHFSGLTNLIEASNAAKQGGHPSFPTTINPSPPNPPS